MLGLLALGSLFSDPEPVSAITLQTPANSVRWLHLAFPPHTEPWCQGHLIPNNIEHLRNGNTIEGVAFENLRDGLGTSGFTGYTAARGADLPGTLTVNQYDLTQISHTRFGVDIQVDYADGTAAGAPAGLRWVQIVTRRDNRPNVPTPYVDPTPRSTDPSQPPYPFYFDELPSGPCPLQALGSGFPLAGSRFEIPAPCPLLTDEGVEVGQIHSLRLELKTGDPALEGGGLGASRRLGSR